MTRDDHDRIEGELAALPLRDLSRDAHARVERAMDRARRQAPPLRRVPVWAAVAASLACGAIGWLARGTAAPPAAPSTTVRVAAPIERLFPRDAVSRPSDPRRWRVLEVTHEEPRNTEN